MDQFQDSSASVLLKLKNDVDERKRKLETQEFECTPDKRRKYSDYMVCEYKSDDQILRKTTSSFSASTSTKMDSRDSKKLNSTQSSRNKSNGTESVDKQVSMKQLTRNDEIDGNSGVSFAKALEMCNHSASNRKIVSRSSSCSRPKTEAEALKKYDGLSPFPNFSLNSNIKTSPETSLNSNPLSPDNHLNVVNSEIDAEIALNGLMRVNKIRTKVYSGTKTGYTSIPSLHSLCVRTLIKNIDGIQHTGRVPFNIFKPILEKATPRQLLNLELHNPHFIQDTDSLWKLNCSHEFRNQQKRQSETWRAMYLRCSEERETKLKKVTANTKQSIDNSRPIRSTKVAYVNDVVKPPQDVIRNQAKNGIAPTSTNSTSDIKQKFLNKNTSVTLPLKSQDKPSSKIAKKKKKTAPLMARAIRMAKTKFAYASAPKCF